MSETTVVETTSAPAEVLEPLAVQEPAKIQPVRPAFLDDTGESEIRKQANEVATAVIANPTDVQLTANVYGLGADFMGANTDGVALMETKIGTVMNEIELGNPVNKSLVAIKAQLDTINPAVVGKTELTVPRKILFGLITRTTSVIPHGDQVLEIINQRKDTVSSTINGLKLHLWEARDQALRNAVELGGIANQLFATQRDLQKAAYMGQLIWEQLSTARDTESDPLRKQALTTLVNDLAIQVVDLQTVDTLNVQSRMAAESLIANTQRINQGVARVTNVLLPAVTVNLGVKAAAAQQAQLVGTLAQISRSAEETILDTARSTREVTVKMEQMQTSAVINADALQKSCLEFEQMQIELEMLRAEAEQKARATSQILSNLSDRMRVVADPMTEKRQALATLGKNEEKE